jgi:hypothetical protein
VVRSNATWTEERNAGRSEGPGVVSREAESESEDVNALPFY